MLLQRVTGTPTRWAHKPRWNWRFRRSLGFGPRRHRHMSPGMAADFIAYRLERLEFTGASTTRWPAGFCTPVGVDLAVVNGRVRVEDGQIVDLELHPLIARHNAISRAMIHDEKLPAQNGDW